MDLDVHPPGGGQPLQEGQVGFLALVLPVEREGVGIVEQLKPVALGDFSGYGLQGIAFPCLRFFRFPQPVRERGGHGLDADLGRRAGIFHLIDLERAAVQGGVLTGAEPVRAQDTHGHLGPFLGSPFPEPLAVPVVQIEAYFVGLARGVVGVGCGQERGGERVRGVMAADGDGEPHAPGVFLLLFPVGYIHGGRTSSAAKRRSIRPRASRVRAVSALSARRCSRRVAIDARKGSKTRPTVTASPPFGSLPSALRLVTSTAEAPC